MSLFDEQALRQIIREELREVLREEREAEKPAPSTGYVSPETAAAHVAMSAKWIRGLLRAGEVPGKKAGSRWRVKITDLEAYMSRIDAEEAGVIDLNARADELLRKSR